MKYKKLTITQKLALQHRIKVLLFAGLDWCANTDRDERYWFSPINPYYCEAFGVLQGLEVLNYGHFGAINVSDEYNLKYWMEELKSQVEEKGIELGPKQAYYQFIHY